MPGNSRLGSHMKPKAYAIKSLKFQREGMEKEVLGAIESSVVALLSKLASGILSKLVTGGDLIAVAISVYVLCESMPKVQFVHRIMDVFSKIAKGMAFNLILQQVHMKESLLSLSNLLCVTLLLNSVQTLSVPAQYLFADQMVAAANKLGDDGFEAILLAMVLTTTITQDEMCHKLSSLVLVNYLNTWLSSHLPGHLRLVTAMLMLYFCAPLLDRFPALTKIYNFAIYTSSDKLGVPGTLCDTPACFMYILACFMYILAYSNLFPDTLCNIPVYFMYILA